MLAPSSPCYGTIGDDGIVIFRCPVTLYPSKKNETKTFASQMRPQLLSVLAHEGDNGLAFPRNGT